MIIFYPLTIFRKTFINKSHTSNSVLFPIKKELMKKELVLRKKDQLFSYKRLSLFFLKRRLFSESINPNISNRYLFRRKKNKKHKKIS